MIRGRSPKVVVTRKGVALTYSIVDYPSVAFHFPFNETSGDSVTDEVLGITVNPNQDGGGSLTFSTNSVSVTRTADGSYPLLNANWPTFTAGKYIYQLMSYRSIDDGLGEASGSNTIGIYSDPYLGPAMFGSPHNGAHVTIVDDADNGFSIAADVTKKATIGSDFLSVLIIRPTGENIEHRLYSSAGVLLWTQSAANGGANGAVGTITPAARVQGGNGSRVWGGGPTYQRITYQFDAEPSDIAAAFAWHATMAPSGVKAPYPGWKGRS